MFTNKNLSDGQKKSKKKLINPKLERHWTEKEATEIETGNMIKKIETDMELIKLQLTQIKSLVGLL